MFESAIAIHLAFNFSIGLIIYFQENISLRKYDYTFGDVDFTQTLLSYAMPLIRTSLLVNYHCAYL